MNYLLHKLYQWLNLWVLKNYIKRYGVDSTIRGVEMREGTSVTLGAWAEAYGENKTLGEILDAKLRTRN